MGSYYSPAEDVVEGRVGRRLEDLGDTYESYTNQLEEGEDLYLGTNNGAWNLVILLDTPHEFTHVCNNRQGKGPYTFYALPRQPA